MPNKQSWLDLLLEATSNLESPKRFFYWAGIASISALVKKNIYLDKFAYHLYPNVYVLLVSAKSGLRKGIPVSYSKSIVEKVNNTRIITGRNSVQGVIRDLSQQVTLNTPEGVKVYSDAQAFLCAPELDSFMVRDEQGLSILTDLYNTHENDKEWKNSLKSSPVEALKNPCITFLAASNEALLEGLIKEKDVEGGFIARTMIVHESKRRMSNSLMFAPDNLISKAELADRIKYLRDVKGPFFIERNVRLEYDKWYKDLEKHDYQDRTGTMERIGDHVLKVGMLISLAYGPELEMTMDHLHEAIDKVQECLVGTRKATMTQGKAETADAAGRVIKILLEAEKYTVSRSKLLDKLTPDVNVMMLNLVLDDLGENGRNVLSWNRRDGKIYYTLSAEVAETYIHLGGKLKANGKASVN